MRHRKSGIKLNRTASHRNAMFRNMVTSLFKNDRIQTTDVKAKALRGWADHLVTLAKRGDLHARRQALSIIREKDVVHKLFETAEKRFGSVAGGYTRIVKLGTRSGDAAPMSLIELVTAESASPKPKKKKKTAKPAAKASAAAKETKKKKKAPEKKADAAEKGAKEAPAVDEGAEPEAPEADDEMGSAQPAGPAEPEPEAETGEKDGEESAATDEKKEK